MNPAFSTPVSRGHAFAYAAVGTAVGVGVGAFVTRWVIRRRRLCEPRTFSEEEKRAYELLSRLAEMTGNPDLSPARACLEDIVREIQLTMGLSRTDGVWNPETERAVLGLLQQQPNPGRPAPISNPAQELEPDENWEATYEREFPKALAQCCEDDGVIAFDQAVVAVLECAFPDAGSFALTPATGPWKKAARERTYHDLVGSLGSSELEARAVLCRSAGVEALASGEDFGQAVRRVAERAWPTAPWDAPERAPWQDAFVQAAATALQA